MLVVKKEQVPGIKRLWPREPDFSEWLATENGVALLPETLKMEVENFSRESRPG